MTLLPLIKQDISILTKVSEPFDFDKPPMDPNQLARDLVQTMMHYNGLGIAAIQCNIPYRVFAMRGAPEMYVFFNPMIVDDASQIIKMEEGCLSFPGLVVDIKRPGSIRLRYTMANGETDTKLFTGMSARVIQHEIDHLDGVLFFNRANKYKRNLAMKQQAKYLRFQKSKEQLIKAEDQGKSTPIMKMVAA